MAVSDVVIQGSYEPSLVVLSVFISILASYAALDLAGRVTSASGRSRQLWLAGGSVAMGLGIWSMHYVGMLALRLPIPVLYDWPTVLVSLLASILASAVALFVVSRSDLSGFNILTGSILMGSGIAAMHYIGMDAMRLPAMCMYSHGLVALSVILAIATSLVAISLTFSLRGQKKSGGWKKPISALAMGVAIPLMHYTGMAAVSFMPAPLSAQSLAHAVGISTLGVASIVVVTSMVLGVVLLTAQFDRQFALQSLALEFSEKRYRRIVETTFDAFVGLDAEGRILDWNSKAEALFGWARSQVMGRPLSELLALEGDAGAKQEYMRFLLSALQAMLLKKPMQLKAVNRDRHEFPIELTMAAIQLDDDEMFAVFIHDITEQVNATEKLRTSVLELENLKYALDQHAIVARTNPRGIITFANDKFCSISKYSREELIGQDHRIVNSKFHSKEFMKDLWDTIQSGRPWKGEVKNRAKDGAEFWESSTIVPFSDIAGQTREYIVIRTDITGLKKIEEELRTAKETAERASRSKSEFLANMSHEIRTPLNGIVGMTDLALGTDLNSEQREYLDTVKMSADSLLTVINDILDFSKIEAGKVDLEAVNFDLRDCMELTLKTLALRASQKRLELLCDVAPEVPEMVRADSSRLRQIVINLVGNAIKFTQRGEVALKVQTETNKDGDRVLRITVADTGIGIAPEKQKVIFEAFSQADTSTTRRFGGTGLGLTISTRLVEMMGGRLWVESEVNRGSQFHFTLPLVVPALAQVNAEPAASPEILKGARALIVDDNSTNRRILEGILRRWEMKAVSVRGGAKALERLSEAHAIGEPYSLILTDMNMPEMDGFTLARKIRQSEEFSRVAVMMLTSAGNRGDGAQCSELGIAAYLLKPIRQSELRAAIVLALGSRDQLGTTPLVTRYSVQNTANPATNLHVLLVEDNVVNQRLASRLLEKRGHRVTVAENGIKGIEAIAEQPFDLVLMDMQMPEMDGFDATAAIRLSEKQSGAHVPIVALTAHAMKGDRERCIAAGMDGYLSKPIRPQELDELLEAYVSRLAGTARVAETVEQSK